MTPERMAELVVRWVRLYTRGLPPAVADRRAGEIRADLHDHIAHHRADGIADRRIAAGIAARMLRGLAADVSWRGRMRARGSTHEEAVKRTSITRRSVARVLLVTGVVLLVPLIAMQLGDGVSWTLADFVFAGALLAGTGLLLDLAVKKPRNPAYRATAVAIAAAAIVLGEADDAPGLVLFGCLLIAGTVALSVRAVRRGA